MRTILLELERVYNHIADIGAIAMDVGFVIANAHAGRMREMVLDAQRGTHRQPPAARHGLRRRRPPGLDRARRSPRCAARSTAVEREFRDLVALDRSPPIPRATGWSAPAILAPGESRGAGHCRAWAAAPPASTWTCAAIIPTPPTAHLTWRVPVYQEGDVLHRMQVRIDEVAESIGMIRAAAENLPAGPHRAPAAADPARAAAR